MTQSQIIQRWVDWHINRYNYLKKYSLVKVVMGRARILESKIIRV